MTSPAEAIREAALWLADAQVPSPAADARSLLLHVTGTEPAGLLTNPSGRPGDGWKALDYAALADVASAGQARQAAFSDIDTAQTDLAAFARAGGKLLAYHGWSDEYLSPLATIRYFEQAAVSAGGVAELQRFHRLFLIPGMGHDSWPDRSGSIDAATLAPLPAQRVPLPQTATGRDELFQALVDWVEKSSPPERIDLSSRDDSVSLPICSHPRKARFLGMGSAQQAAHYLCE